MKIKNGFVLNKIADECLLIPIGANAELIHGIIRLNNTAEDMWQGINNSLSKEDIIRNLTEKYEITEEEASIDFDDFVDELFKMGCLIE